jgi:hypothetical protein
MLHRDPLLPLAAIPLKRLELHREGPQQLDSDTALQRNQAIRARAPIWSYVAEFYPLQNLRCQSFCGF